ncbi:hypothetical protein Y032_0018g3667 [Ancylostoma ceylanicum]|uniref:SCP domain-containing protein n=1 Tax=Ancylostoma ceylanicum TaxID=53326 RepID=A0A016V2Y7_9BILA|nr:hypothetical protein Y032_0018g3667 [Ancylostoma ceylanicum]
MDSLKDFCGSVRHLGTKCKIVIILCILLLGFCAIGLREFITNIDVFLRHGNITSALLLKPGDVSSECEKTSTMSKKSRQAVLDWHNDYRSRVAKGEYKIENDDSTLKVLPTAARMPMLVSF